MFYIGLDIGSVSVKGVVFDANINITERHYIRHYGHPIKEALKLLDDLLTRYPDVSLSLTGNGSKIIAGQLGINHINEIVCQCQSVRRLLPQVKTIIELGGEDSKLIILGDEGIKEFSLNSVCAAGTGSFLEQQAERLRLTIEEFSEMAVRSKRPSKIAGRCSVFAKSDMIHLQQIATPVEDIVAGLCFAVARNFKGTIAKGIDLVPPISFQGGVAANAGMLRAFKEVLNINDIIVHEDYAFMGAIGAVYKDREANIISMIGKKDLERLKGNEGINKTFSVYDPLIYEGDRFFERHLNGRSTSQVKNDGIKTKEVYLGIDIGSISTNLAVIDKDNRLISKRYLMTAGRPIEAVNQGLREIWDELGRDVVVLGVGTTGSGRYMIADYVGADIVKNEITAQATAAIAIDPDIDTIFEIGGQDSKYISIKDGVIVDFEMNKACAAGTGSFLEEQAEKLDIDIKGEFTEKAFQSKTPCRLGERCTVFMENSLMSNLQSGIDKQDLIAGLSYSIVQNYINRVVAGKHIGKRIFFQGGVAFNKAVVAAFEKYLNCEITVPPDHDVTGAIGMALIAKEYMQEKKTVSSFKGFDIAHRPYEIDSFECKGCPNVCEINRVKVIGEDGYLFYGGRCEKYDVRKVKSNIETDLFIERENMLWRNHLQYSQTQKGNRGIKIGLPYIFNIQDYLPFWTTLLWELGFDVVVSPKTNKQIITLGVENVLSEACFPVKVAHGHVQHLINQGVDELFIPSITCLPPTDAYFSRSVACPYTQTIAYIVRLALKGCNPIIPVIDYSRGIDFISLQIYKSLSRFGITKGDVSRAMKKALLSQKEFEDWRASRGREIFDEIKAGKDAIVILGRGYNSFDYGMNLEIPKKLSQLNVLTIPMDMLPLEDIRIDEDWPNMYWRSGQRILKAGRIIRDIPNLNAIFIGNFSCGPDSFILKYLRKDMADKSFLHIEIDEHSADAGAITRCEAFLDSIQQKNKRFKQTSLQPPRLYKKENPVEIKRRKIYIPNMTDHAMAIKAAFNYCGIDAEVLPMSDTESIEIGKRYVSGKECYPFMVTTGDMLKKAFSPDFDPSKSAFFMPSGTGPCRFGQYNEAQRLILRNIGLDDVPVFAPTQNEGLYKEMGIVGREFTKKAWQGIVSNEILLKCLFETRPYEINKGDAEALYNHYHKRLYDTLIRPDGDIPSLLREIKDAFRDIPIKKEKRPLIGIVGEIYVRSHVFSNEDLVRKIENLGGEVWLAPVEEWILYVNHISLRRALIKKDFSGIMSILLTRFFQNRIHHSYAHIFEDFLKTIKEPDTKEVLNKASQYVSDTFEGETVLSVGKTIDLIQKGASGIINAMPFGCMPGTIVTAILKSISRTYNVPCISIPYDGTQSPVIQLQLEAFMETARSKIQS
ncbi:MAG: acyl-CoA dehydratase activase [Thermodesulfovibrionales bacterium]|nr:acyl-CoA dehydratase activase [Thermodesulfovibrionales bacterium]